MNGILFHFFSFLSSLFFIKYTKPTHHGYNTVEVSTKEEEEEEEEGGLGNEV